MPIKLIRKALPERSNTPTRIPAPWASCHARRRRGDRAALAVRGTHGGVDRHAEAWEVEAHPDLADGQVPGPARVCGEKTQAQQGADVTELGL